MESGRSDATLGTLLPSPAGDLPGRSADTGSDLQKPEPRRTKAPWLFSRRSGRKGASPVAMDSGGGSLNRAFWQVTVVVIAAAVVGIFGWIISMERRGAEVAGVLAVLDARLDGLEDGRSLPMSGEVKAKLSSIDDTLRDIKTEIIQLRQERYGRN